MNMTAASAAVYSLVAILLLAGLAALLPEMWLAHFRLRRLEAGWRSSPPEALAQAVAIYLLPGSPSLWLRWASRGFPPLGSLLDPVEVRSALSRL